MNIKEPHLTDVLCNKEIKFDVFLRYALKLNADYVATGHYVKKITNKDGTDTLIAGKDKSKTVLLFMPPNQNN